MGDPIALSRQHGWEG